MSLCSLLSLQSSTVCRYVTLYLRLVICQSLHCCFLTSVHYLSVPYTVPSAFCVTVTTALLYILSNVCQYHRNYSLLVLCHCVHRCLLYSVQCMSVPNTERLLVLCQCFHCCLLKSIHCLSVSDTVLSDHSLSVTHTAPSFGSVSLCPLLSSPFCPLHVNTS